MAIWLSADWYLWHTNILHHCNRPFTNTKEMHETIITNYCSTVIPGDTVFFLGDFTLNSNSWTLDKAKDLLEDMPGTKHLILGNHDKFKIWSYLKMGFASVHTHYPLRPEITAPATFLVHDPKQALGPGFCGHVHDNWLTSTEYAYPLVNVGVDMWNFKPVSYITALTTLRNLQ